MVMHDTSSEGFRGRTGPNVLADNAQKWRQLQAKRSLSCPPSDSLEINGAPVPEMNAGSSQGGGDRAAALARYEAQVKATEAALRKEQEVKRAEEERLRKLAERTPQQIVDDVDAAREKLEANIRKAREERGK